MATKRPDDLPFPMVWKRFTAKDSEGNEKKFKIQDCPPEMYEELLDFMCDFFMKDETFNTSTGLHEDEEAIKDFRTFQSLGFHEKLVVVCLEDDGIDYDMKTNKPKIYGFSHCFVDSDDLMPDFEPKSKSFSKLCEIFMEFSKHNDTCKRFGVKEYLGDGGLGVHPNTRKMGIAKHLLNTRKQIAEALGLKVIEAIFTSSVSQQVAEKCGFETVYSLPYDQFETLFNIKAKTTSKYAKLMALVL